MCVIFGNVGNDTVWALTACKGLHDGYTVASDGDRRRAESVTSKVASYRDVSGFDAT